MQPHRFSMLVWRKHEIILYRYRDRLREVGRIFQRTVRTRSPTRYRTSREINHDSIR